MTEECSCELKRLGQSYIDTWHRLHGKPELDEDGLPPFEYSVAETYAETRCPIHDQAVPPTGAPSSTSD